MNTLLKNFIANTVLFTCIGLQFQVDACTGIKLTAKDGTQVNGRTLEFGIPVQASVALIPRNYEFQGTTPKGPGLSYKSKYATVGAIAFNNVQLMDGMNEKGLVVGTFYFPGYAGYTETTSENQSKSLSPIDFPNWILTQFATLDEVKAALPSVVIAPTVVKQWGDTPAPFHYIVYDKQGEALVIEPINGKLVTYQNKMGVFTNSPTFDWHLTNLRNYINLNPENTKPLKEDGVVLSSFGQGSGMVGLPGDFTPPSRFVRAAIFSYTSIPVESGEKNVNRVFHILNQFDIPVGAARDTVNGKIYSDSTQVTSVKDPNTLKYYFKTYDNQSIKFADLSKFDFDSHGIKVIETTGNETAIDVTKQAKTL